jgi:acetyl/propionyl-CoA carboxylase alpha subunit/acetyl-CoA carboxylase carboxyltransferase component
MFKRLLIANRGEIAIRIARTAAELDINSVMIYSQDDAASLHIKAADEAVALTGFGPPAYLDGPQILRLALETGCDAIHPGYGFLSENAAFSRLCNNAGVVFVGPAPETLALFGDKVQTRALAKRIGAPVLPGSLGAVTLEQAEGFLAGLGGSAAMLKARAGGGGRGMREVHKLEHMASAFERCRSEALQAFGDGELYVEQFFPRARHVEVQIVGDGTEVAHVWDRECSVQRQRQKLIETAPAFGLASNLRTELLELSVALGRAVNYRGLGTIEFLVDQDPGSAMPFAFIEANPRLQVEHTVTEAITGLDLVSIQLKLAAGGSLSKMGLRQFAIPAPRGVAIESRVNLESMNTDGTARPTGGTLSVYEPASGPGIRVDGFGYSGYRTSVNFDSLLAKVIVHVADGDLARAARKAERALSEFRIAGVPTNIPFLRALLKGPAFANGEVHTRYIQEHAKTLCAEAAALTPKADSEQPRRPGVKLESQDPLAVLHHGKGAGDAATPIAASPAASPDIAVPDGTIALPSPLQGTILEVAVTLGKAVRAGDPVLVMESMKMEHVITSPISGLIRALNVAPGDTVFEGHPLAFIEHADVAVAAKAREEIVDLDFIRPDLAAVMERHRGTLDAGRPNAVARRRKSGQRTARENVDDLLDTNSFIEYGSLVVAARRKRHSLENLIEQTPADGMVMGLGRVNGKHFGDEASRCAVMAYDYTVLAGTQGAYNHRKMDRLIEAAERWRLPTVFFCEGGGGRPGDTEGGGYVRGFELWARMSALAPLVGITSGRCFAGNASVLGCCDVIIATKGSNIGMGGPAMIEGGGLGIFRPEEIGPVEVQEPNGVIDILAEDEADAVRIAKKYLSYFQGTLSEWGCADQRLLRRAIPENRVRVYDMRHLIETLADTGSVLELRPKFGTTMVAALLRIEGRPMGVIANNPKVLGGAIDSDGSDKAARFLQVCEAFDIPVLSLSDTPGMMVGPEVEKTALVRHCSRLFIIGANLTVPMFSVVLRKSYGLGALAMTGGSYPASVFAVAWPTGEFGGMGLEGSVKLGYRNELAAIKDPVARKAKFDEMVAAAYEHGKALNQASTYHIDEVIDPADTRRWIVAGLRSVPPAPARTEKKLRWIDAW